MTLGKRFVKRLEKVVEARLRLERDKSTEAKMSYELESEGLAAMLDGLVRELRGHTHERIGYPWD